MWRWRDQDIAETLEELVSPATTALIMWDYAQGLVDRAVDKEAFVASSAALLDGARRAGVHVFFSKQAEMPWEDVGPGLIRMRMKQMNIRSSDGFVSPNAKGTAAGAFVDALAPLKTETVFEKFLPNAFSGTNLGWRLHARGIKTLIIAGISLETGVDGTAREAVNRGYYAIIPREAVASTSKRRLDLAMQIAEEIHEVAACRDILGIWHHGGAAAPA